MQINHEFYIIQVESKARIYATEGCDIMITVKKGQTVDFRSPKVPSYIKETKEIARELIQGLELGKEAYAPEGASLKKHAKIDAKQTTETRPHIILWNKIKKVRNATHQEG